MLYPHSLFWHYLWVGPHVLQVILALIIWRRGQRKLFPVFFAYILYEATEEFTLWTGSRASATGCGGVRSALESSLRA